MATYTYDLAESRDIDFIRGALDDTTGCGFPTTGTGSGAEFADETINARLLEAGNKWEATAVLAERLIARYARRETTFNAGAGQVQVQWADRMTGLKDLVLQMRAQAPLADDRTTAYVQHINYGGGDPYSNVPDYYKPPSTL